jgi:hypothetical protein
MAARKKTVAEKAAARLARLNSTNRARVEPLAGNRVLNQDDQFYRRDVVMYPGGKPLTKPGIHRATTRESPRSLYDSPPSSYDRAAQTILLRADAAEREKWAKGPFTTRTFRGKPEK